MGSGEVREACMPGESLALIFQRPVSCKLPPRSARQQGGVTCAHACNRMCAHVCACVGGAEGLGICNDLLLVHENLSCFIIIFM